MGDECSDAHLLLTPASLAARKLLIDYLRRERGLSQQVEAVEEIGEIGRAAGRLAPRRRVEGWVHLWFFILSVVNGCCVSGRNGVLAGSKWEMKSRSARTKLETAASSMSCLP